MFITGPDVIKTVTGEEVDFESLGGAMSHNTKSGVAHFASEDEDACLEDTRYLLSFLPQNNLETPSRGSCRPTTRCAWTRSSTASSPTARTSRTTCATSIRLVVDDGEFFEVHEHYARNIVVGFARLNGYAVGVVGNQPAQLAGVLDIDASAKAARFVRTLRRVQHPAAHALRRARLPARHRAGVGRDHPPRREAAVRLRRGDGPEDHRHHAQGVRRRVRRHGVQAPARRLQLRLADGRGRGHGPRGRGEHHLPPRHREVADARRRAARS